VQRSGWRWRKQGRGFRGPKIRSQGEAIANACTRTPVYIVGRIQGARVDLVSIRAF
jgi:hypothetical protein